MDQKQTETGAAAELGRRMALIERTPVVVDDQTTGTKRIYVPTPDGGWQPDDISDRLPTPRRLVQNVKVTDAQGFLAYLTQFGLPLQTVVFRQPPMLEVDHCGFLAAIDYHLSPSTPSWMKHTATFKMRYTQAWADWLKSHNVLMSQTDFAQFLEDRIPEIEATSMTAATIVEMARSFEALTNVQFKSVVSERDGSRKLTYAEDVTPGSMPLPEGFSIVVPPFEGSEPVLVKARIRYQIAGGVLKLKYMLIRADDAMRTAFDKTDSFVVEHAAPFVRAFVTGAPADGR